MMRIKSFGLFRLHNNEHFQLMKDFITLVIRYTAKELGIDEFYDPFNNALNAEETALKAEQGSSKSKAIENQNKLRDKTWKALHTRVKSGLHSPIDDEVESAEAIMRLFDLDGDVRKLTLNEESAAISTLTNNLMLQANATHLEKLGITAWVNQLRVQNEAFQVLFNERNAELASRISGDVRAARKEVDPLFEQIVERINATLVLGTAKPVATIFAADLNERFSYYKTTITARASRNKNKNRESMPPKKSQS